MSQLLTIIGNIGSGKSSAVPILGGEFNAKSLMADELFQTTDPFAKLFLNDLSRWALTNELWLTLRRKQMLDHHLEEYPNSLTIIDSGLCMSWVYAYSHYAVDKISQDEWELFRDLFDEVVNGHMRGMKVLRLNYSTQTLLQRIKKRGRDFELEYYTAEYLAQLEQGIQYFCQYFQDQGVIQLVELTEAQAADFEHSATDRKTLIAKADELLHS